MTPAIEAIARNLVRQEYYRLGLQPSEGVEQYVAKEWPDRISDARAALQALRVPTDAMTQAGEVLLSEEQGHSLSDHDLRDAWMVMVDAALAEQP